MYELYKFAFYNLLFLIIIFIFFYKINKNIIGDKLDLWLFVNKTKKLNYKNIGVGLIFGIVFGIIDNVGLWLGISSFQKHINTDAKTQAAIGNTYSDFIGAVLGSLISITAKNSISYDEDTEPIWVTTIGIFIGTIIGLFIGRIFLSKIMN